MPSDTEAGRGRAAASANGTSRRDELLTVAAKLFAARGYHGTRMDDVAEAVGLNKATVYHYYSSKSLILYDLYKSTADFTVEALHDDPTASARETIYHFTRRLLTGIANDLEKAAVYFQEGALHHRVVHRGAGGLHPPGRDAGL